MKSRLNKLYSRLKKQKLDGLLVSNPVNVGYLNNLRSEKTYLFLTPGFNKQIKELKLPEEIQRFSKRLKLKRLGFEENSLVYARYKQLKSHLSSTKLVPTANLVEELREIKEAGELKIIRKAISIAESVFRSVLNFIKPGLRERDIAGRIDSFLKTSGAKEPSFPVIVTSGERTSLPHGCPTSKKLRKNQPVLIDLGAYFNGYNSDLTRMVFLGKMSPRFRKIYNLLMGAQHRAIRKIAPGVRACDVDRAARSYLGKHGLAKYFVHGLGHGVGRAVHERPIISQNNTATLKKGMVLTVEPGVYIPKWGGIRIEDMVLVTNRGCELLSNLSRSISPSV